MALSNWDTLALDQDGKPTNGVFISPLGVRVELYRNWLYIQDAPAWRDHGGFVHPTVMEIQHGELHYLDVRIHAVRGPQEGIHVLVTSGYHHNGTLTAMAGIGCYGFHGDRWCGVSAESLHAFSAWLMSDALESYTPDALRNADFSQALRFNQGDAYFAEQLGFEVPATQPGESDEPLISLVL